MRLFSSLAISLSIVFGFATAQANTWETHGVSLRASAQKIRLKEAAIAELIQAKKTVTDQEQMAGILVKITKEHEEYKKLLHDFEKEKQHVRFDHPEQGEVIERQYRPVKLKSLEQFETEGGIDGKLSELKQKVKSKYGEPKSPEPSPTATPVFNKQDQEKAEREKKRIKLSY